MDTLPRGAFLQRMAHEVSDWEAQLDSCRDGARREYEAAMLAETATLSEADKFGVVMVVGRQGDAGHDLAAYRGLGRSQPVLAALFTVLLLSQAGVPFTVGFVAKFGMIGAAADVGSWALAVVAMLSAAIAAFLYLRVIVAMYLVDADGEVPAPAPVPLSAALAVGAAAVFTLVVGVVPSPLLDFARDAVPVLALR